MIQFINLNMNVNLVIFKKIINVIIIIIYYLNNIEKYLILLIIIYLNVKNVNIIKI